MQMNYVLIADGSVTLPVINHTLLDAHDPNTADREITRIIQTLSKIGYYRFTMLDVRTDGHHKVIATYNVETPEPVVTRVDR